MTLVLGVPQYKPSEKKMPPILQNSAISPKNLFQTEISLFLSHGSCERQRYQAPQYRNNAANNTIAPT